MNGTDQLGMMVKKTPKDNIITVMMRPRAQIPAPLNCVFWRISNLHSHLINTVHSSKYFDYISLLETMK